MALSVCLVCSEDSATNAKRASNVAKLLRSPDIKISMYNVPSRGPTSSTSDGHVPSADFLLDCLPGRLFNTEIGSSKELNIPLSKRESFVRLLAAQSEMQEQISEPVLNAIRMRLRNSDEQFRMDPLRETSLESGRDEKHNFFSILAFASMGSTLVLTCVELDVLLNNGTDSGLSAIGDFTVIQDPASIAVLRTVINSIASEPTLSGLDGCFRVSIAIEKATDTISDINIDLSPRIFHQQQSFDDLMVSHLPGGHEALLCLLLTRHQQKSKGLTVKQATVRAAFDAISAQTASSYDCIAHVAVMRSVAFHFSWDGSVLDVGCGQGVFGGLLNLYHPGIELYGTDMSEAMVEAPQIKQYYRSPIQIGPMEQTLITSPTTDHIACFSVFQYVPMITFIAAVSQMFLKARKSITFDIPEVDRDYTQKLTATNSLWRPSDHLAALNRIGTPAGWKLVMHRHCLTYTEPNYEHDVYSRYVRYERVD